MRALYSLRGSADDAALSPCERDSVLGIAYIALAQAIFTRSDGQETQRWARLAIRMHPRAAIRCAIMIATCGFTGAMEEVREQRDFLASFAPEPFRPVGKPHVAARRLATQQHTNGPTL